MMANNKISLVNKNTGKWITLARYYPNSGWTVSINEEQLQDMLSNEKDDHPFKLVYDVDESKTTV